MVKNYYYLFIYLFIYFILFYFSRQLDGDSGELLAGTDWDQVQLQVSRGMCFWLPSIIITPLSFFKITWPSYHLVLFNCLSGRPEMCDWLSNLYYATFWPRTLQEELLIAAHSFTVVFTRVPCHVSWGVRRILFGQTARVSGLSISLPQEDTLVTRPPPL